MIDYSDFKKGTRIILNNQPHEIIEASPIFKGRGHSTLQVKLKNLITGNVIPQTFHPSDNFDEAELQKIKAKFLYSNQGQCFFSEESNPANRFNLTEEQIGRSSQFLKPNQVVEGITFENKVINISLPIKIPLRVIESPPGLKGERSQPGTKMVTLETGAKINTPLFIKEGDIIEINTQTGEYVKRIES